MALLRIVTEHLLLIVFRIARSTFLAQGIAAGTALFALTRIPHQDAPPWLDGALRSSLLVSVTLFIAGVLLLIARRVPDAKADKPSGVAPPGTPVASRSAWPALLGLSLAALPILAYRAASELVPLWREITRLLDDIGFWKELARPGQFSGVVLLPLFAALFVPVLETIAAFFLIAVAPAMLVLLATRSPRLPMIFAMLVACQVGLVVAGLLASAGFSQLSAAAIATMTAAPDLEVHQVAEMLRRGEGVLATTARALVAPMLGYMAWLPFLLLSRQVGIFFAGKN